MQSNIKTKEIYIEPYDSKLFVKQWIPETANRTAEYAKAPIVLLHDSLGCVGLWKDFPESLARETGRTVYAYDRLGYGRSSASNKTPLLDFIKEEASFFVECLKSAIQLEDYYLLGYSAGGAMAINIAAQDDACKGIVSIAAQAFVEERTTEGILNAQQFFSDPANYARLEKWHKGNTQWVLETWVKVWTSPAFSKWSLEDVIGRVSCPMLIVHGEQDEYGSLAFPRFIEKGSPGHSELLILENCGHAPHTEYPEKVMDAIRAFLDDTPFS